MTIPVTCYSLEKKKDLRDGIHVQDKDQRSNDASMDCRKAKQVEHRRVMSTGITGNCD